jgi:hypothetical protein
MSSITVDIDLNDWERELLTAVRSLRYGSVEVTIHEGRVVQIEKRERVRYQAGRRRPEERGREKDNDERAARTSGGAAWLEAEEKR